MTSYLTSMDTISLSCTVYELFDFKIFRVWPWPLTHESHLRSKLFILFGSPYMTSYLTSIDTISLSRTVLEIFDFKMFRVWPWPLTPEGHLGSKNFIPFESPYMTSYLTSMDTISLSRTVLEIFDIKVFRVWPWSLTPKSHLGSKKFTPFESPYMTSYLTSMNNISPSRTVFEIFDFKISRVWPWPLTPKGHLGSKKFILFESPYMTSYLTSMDNISLSRTVLEIMPLKILKDEQNGGFWPFKGQGQESRAVFEIFDFKVFRVWPWPLTPKGHLGSEKFISFESPYMTSYMSSMDTISLSCTVFEIFDFQVFRVWPWPLTSKGHPGSKIFIPFESLFMTSYLNSMDTISLSRTVLEIFDSQIFRVWPWPLTSKGHLGSKNFIPFESSYMTSYLTSMDTISLSRTVLEIFDFKVFRVWPWPLTPKGHLGSKNCIPFESPYMTSYLTSMDNISPSRTVFEIFDFKVFRVWPWPLTPKGHLGSKNFIPFESPYMTSYLNSMNTISLSAKWLLTVKPTFSWRVKPGITALTMLLFDVRRHPGTPASSLPEKRTTRKQQITVESPSSSKVATRRNAFNFRRSHAGLSASVCRSARIMDHWRCWRCIDRDRRV